ncbi:MAG: nucleotide exchange factor GrpE [Alphaproteobacteria bacterium CG_4_10_14_0_8_um_filter_53_9]|nr:MAG: nucleotide exchange factor GrpE [Alphaproteobacteria bacterium CG_4_10_14_0_8_um_filter_53_9]
MTDAEMRKEPLGEPVSADEMVDAVTDAPEEENLVQALQAELAQTKDAMLRAVAEAENVRKRAATDMENARKFALQSFVKDLLPVVDNLERALSAEADEGALKKGVEMVLTQLISSLNRVGVEKVPAEAGMAPHHDQHQVMQVVEEGDVQSGQIVAVMQAGYSLAGRLVRPALVVVKQ